MMEQMKFFDDGKSDPFSDPLYDLVFDELKRDFTEISAHLAAKDIAARIRSAKLYCECGGKCGCEHS
jgi:hypothetical protein